MAQWDIKDPQDLLDRLVRRVQRAERELPVGLAPGQLVRLAQRALDRLVLQGQQAQQARAELQDQQAQQARKEAVTLTRYDPAKVS